MAWHTERWALVVLALFIISFTIFWPVWIFGKVSSKNKHHHGSQLPTIICASNGNCANLYIGTYDRQSLKALGLEQVQSLHVPTRTGVFIESAWLDSARISFAAGKHECDQPQCHYIASLTVTDKYSIRLRSVATNDAAKMKKQKERFGMVENVTLASLAPILDNSSVIAIVIDKQISRHPTLCRSLQNSQFSCQIGLNNQLDQVLLLPESDPKEWISWLAHVQIGRNENVLKKEYSEALQLWPQSLETPTPPRCDGPGNLVIVGLFTTLNPVPTSTSTLVETLRYRSSLLPCKWTAIISVQNPLDISSFSDLLLDSTTRKSLTNISLLLSWPGIDGSHPTRPSLPHLFDSLRKLSYDPNNLDELILLWIDLPATSSSSQPFVSSYFNPATWVACTKRVVVDFDVAIMFRDVSLAVQITFNSENEVLSWANDNARLLMDTDTILLLKKSFLSTVVEKELRHLFNFDQGDLFATTMLTLPELHPMRWVAAAAAATAMPSVSLAAINCD